MIRVKRVAFQGERGAYSEEAALKHFKSSTETLPLRTLPEVFDAVKGDGASHGIVPIENSIEGSVNETYDLLLDSPLKVAGEVNLRIIHCLISHSNAKFSDIRTVYSHPQALAQCRGFLQALKCEVIPFYDTAGSVKAIKEKELKDAAAIASKRAAEIYNMTVLKEGIEDRPDNYTRFLILSKRDSFITGRDKTSVIFSTKHIPGALYESLGEFAGRNINLTMIVSRPVKKTPWEYNFYVDFEGHRGEKRVEECLRGLRKRTSFIKILGSYPKWEEA